MYERLLHYPIVIKKKKNSRYFFYEIFHMIFAQGRQLGIDVYSKNRFKKILQVKNVQKINFQDKEYFKTKKILKENILNRQLFQKVKNS